MCHCHCCCWKAQNKESCRSRKRIDRWWGPSLKSCCWRVWGPSMATSTTQFHFNNSNPPLPEHLNDNTTINSTCVMASLAKKVFTQWQHCVEPRSHPCSSFFHWNSRQETLLSSLTPERSRWTHSKLFHPFPCLFVCSLVCLLICFDSVFLFIAQEFVDNTKVEGLLVSSGVLIVWGDNGSVDEGWLVMLMFVAVVGGDRAVKGSEGFAGGGKEGGRVGRVTFWCGGYIIRLYTLD